MFPGFWKMSGDENVRDNISNLKNHREEGSVVGVESSKFVLPDLVLKGFDLPVYSVLNVIQHSLSSLGSRVNCQVFLALFRSIMSCRIPSDT
ncbi:hypothetical protein TNCV_3501781 [Trichonephila clavipes]|uniref:Uncharacterized protein n=1 Tax=Trichonephila clavipes TaxID=2585209 RepID=A0A8X6RY39_TRICX|nr:hypothetical protein TNCV_3501781 [Trichonephila clavipes]